MKEIQAPFPVVGHYNSLPKIFLAGSIEMGTAEKWQDRFCKDLADYDVVVLNPRRDDWDSSWVQSINDSQFFRQVTWEQDWMEEADIVVFFFDPQTKAPITLMELGITLGRLNQNGVSNQQTVLVCCPDDYWRKGNVDIMCHRAAVPMTTSYQSLLGMLKTTLDVEFPHSRH
jgi:hypothetical protein